MMLLPRCGIQHKEDSYRITVNVLYLQCVGSDNFTDSSDKSNLPLTHSLNHINPIYSKSPFPHSPF